MGQKTVDALKALRQGNPALYDDIIKRHDAGETIDKAEIFKAMSLLPQTQPFQDSYFSQEEKDFVQKGREGSNYLGEAMDYLGIEDDYIQALYEKDPSFFKGKKVEEEGDFWSNLLPAATGAGSSIATGMTLGTLGAQIHPTLGLLGLGIGSALPSVGGLLYGQSKGELPEGTLSPEVLGKTAYNVLGDFTGGIVGPKPSEYRGPKTFQELPGVSQPYGTFMDWAVDEPLMAVVMGKVLKGAKYGTKWGLKTLKGESVKDETLKPLKIDPHKPQTKQLEEASGLDTSEIADVIRKALTRKLAAFSKQAKEIKAAGGLPGTKEIAKEGWLKKKWKSFPRADNFGDAIRLAEEMDGTVNGPIYRHIIKPAIEGISLDKVGKGNSVLKRTVIGGQWKLDEIEALELQEFDNLLKELGMGRFHYFGKSHPKMKNVRDFVFKKWPGRDPGRSEALSELIVRRLQDGPDAKGNYNFKGDYKYRGKSLKFNRKKANEMAQWIEGNWKGKLEDINVVREAAGLRPIAGLKNYFPHMFRLNKLEDLWGNLTTVPDDMIDKVLKESLSPLDPKGITASTYRWKKPKGSMPVFGNLKHRLSTREDYNKSIIDVVTHYNRGANRVIQMSLPARIINGRIDILRNNKIITAEQKDILDTWVQEGVLGAPTSADVWINERPNLLWGALAPAKNLAARYARNILIGSTTYFANNVGSVAQSMAVSGMRNTAKAAGSTLPEFIATIIPGTRRWKEYKNLEKGSESLLRGAGMAADNLGMDFANLHSSVMKNRGFTGYEEIIKNMVGRGKWSDFLSHIVDAADQFQVAVSFNAAYMDGIKQGLSHKEAVDWGDKLAFKTQAIYSNMFKPRLLRSKYINQFAPFQTWVNNFNQLVRKDIIGGQLGDISSKHKPSYKIMPSMKNEMMAEYDKLPVHKRIGMGIRLVGSAVALNGIYQSMGLPPPYDLDSVLPGYSALGGATAGLLGGGYGRRQQLFVLKPIYDTVGGLGAFINNDLEGLDNLNDPDIRRAVKGFLNLSLKGGGTQLGRSAEGIADLMQGFSPMKSKRFPSEYEYSYPLERKDAIRALLLGSGRTDPVLKAKYPDTGYYEDEGLESIIEQFMVPQKWERATERIQDWKPSLFR